MKTFIMVMYGIVAASFVLGSSGCYEWNRGGDYSGYDRVGSSYDRSDRRWNGDPVYDRGYAATRPEGLGVGKKLMGGISRAGKQTFQN